MASSNTQIIPSSSSSEYTHQLTYEVFLSFRGEDTRYGFTDHLYQALISNGIHTFKDDNELERGVIASELQKAIEESKIFVIILSPNYTNSRWCLDELVEISQLRRLILPIFYHVDPSDVRKQTGSYEKAFLDHEKQADRKKRDKIQKWRSALMEVGNLCGYDLQKYGYETVLIKEITNVILKELNSKLSLHVSNNMVGMNYHLEKLKSLIEIESDDVRMIGIYGLGGIGKTTISKVVYNNIFYLFGSCIFLEDVSERSQHYEGRLKLQKELLNGAMKGKSMEINSVEEGISVIKQRLCSKKVLILDDVNKSEQLEFLAGKLSWFGLGSRIIITTRDQRLLKEHEVHTSYEVKGLDDDKSFQLFCQYAFKQNVPKKDYINLSKGMVKYANGLPLALKVLGSSLHDRSVLEWKSTLKKLKKNPIDEVQNSLMISFERLDRTYQEIFLDIACFFKGCNESAVIRLVEHAAIGLKVLSEKGLITLHENTIWMHDLVQEMGKDIVRRKNPRKPGKWSRLWDPEDISLVLKKKTGTKAIEGIFLDVSRAREMEFTAEAFTRMKGLRLFEVYWSYGFTTIDLPMDFELSSFELRYFRFQNYPLRSLPTNFHANNLVELNLPRSNIKRLWKENEVLHNLKVICLSSSEDLVEMPDFATMPNLEVLDLEGCTSLENLPRNFHKLQHLESLFCSYCSKLKSFPQIEGNMSNLRYVSLKGTAIVEVPSSIELLNGLEYLDLSQCTNLRNLNPESICNLRSLEALVLGGRSI